MGFIFGIFLGYYFKYFHIWLTPLYVVSRKSLTIYMLKNNCSYLQDEILILALWIHDKVLIATPETCICPAYFTNLRLPLSCIHPCTYFVSFKSI
jgi:hypothetical protein